MINKKVVSIIVLYNSNWNLLREVVKEALSQCSKVFLIDNSTVDNTSIFNSFFSPSVNLVYRALHDNYGIAYAQNFGLKLIKDEGYEYVIFFDQDSVPGKGMVETLLNDLIYLKSKNIKVSTIGPIPINSETNQPYEARLIKNKQLDIDGLVFIPVKQIISSGGLMLVSIFDEVGGFDELLFIDGVDHEWCWRAGTHGYTVFLSPRSKLVHRLGEGDKKILGIKIATTSSFRLFYQFRNYVVLCSRNYVPFYWKFNNLIKYCVKMVYYPLIYKDLGVLRRIFSGIREGVKIANRGK